jgi:hypothetical protein
MERNPIISRPKKSDPFSVHSEPKALHQAGHFLYTLAYGCVRKGGESADLKITTVTEQKGYHTVETEYFTAGFERIDQTLIHPKRTVSSTHVRDLTHARLLIWHGEEPEYIVLRTDPPPAEPKPATGAPELIITTETIDTGERKIFFGQMTRHLLTEETRRWVSDRRRGADSTARLDGWYVDAEGLPASKQHPVGCALSIGREQLRIQANHTGPELSGLAIFLKQTFTHELPGGLTHVDEIISRVAEWVEKPLPDDLFYPPAGYRQVEEFTR